MGKDYRMGLVAGSILAGVALLWVATRPGLAPRPQPVQSPPSRDRGFPTAGGPATPHDAGSTAEPDRPKPGGPGERKMAERAPSPSVPRDLSSGSPNLPDRQKTAPATTIRFHVVRQGETLSSIAQQYYGSPNDWRKILMANEKTIKDANKIAPGTRLIIPE
jgi:nucleoid-associated protein YgaU